MTEPEDGQPRRRGHVAITMTDWDGRRSPAKYLSTWDDALDFLASDNFRLTGDTRSLTLRQLGPARRTLPGGPPGSHWKPSPEQAAALEERAQREFTCRACAAAPGEPCAAPEPGRDVCAARYLDTKKAVIAEARTARPPRREGTA